MYITLFEIDHSFFLFFLNNYPHRLMHVLKKVKFLDIIITCIYKLI